MNNLEAQFKTCVETGELTLPVLPTVGAEVLSLTRREDADASQLAKLVQNDQSLSGHIMRLANSAAYNNGGKIQTLQQAVTKLGMSQIGQMALTVSVGESVFKSNASTDQIVNYLWKHSLASAAWAKEIARQLRSNTEIAFLCGLLHQIGKPVAVNTLVNILEDENEALKNHQSIVALIDKYNQLIGASLAKRWEFPEAVIETIDYIDEYTKAPSAKQEAMIVNAARLLATHTLDDKSDEELLEITNNQPVFSELNLYHEDQEVLVAKSASVRSLIESLTL